MKRSIDITRELLSTAPFPGDPAPRAERIAELERDRYQLTQLSMSAHAATHIDAPLHFLPNAQDIAQLPTDIFLGACTVADIKNIDAQLPALLDCERLLLRGDEFIDEALAQRLCDTLPLRLLGVEKSTVGSEAAPMAAHLVLLERGVAILENLELSEAEPGEYFLCALPLKIAGCEAAPCRAVLFEA